MNEPLPASGSSGAMRGINCPRCKATEWKTRETRRVPGRVIRIKTCRGCRLRVRTRETIEAAGETGPPRAT